jgi:hypothetical protein
MTLKPRTCNKEVNMKVKLTKEVALKACEGIEELKDGLDLDIFFKETKTNRGGRIITERKDIVKTNSLETIYDILEENGRISVEYIPHADTPDYASYEAQVSFFDKDGNHLSTKKEVFCHKVMEGDPDFWDKFPSMEATRGAVNRAMLRFLFSMNGRLYASNERISGDWAGVAKDINGVSSLLTNEVVERLIDGISLEDAKAHVIEEDTEYKGKTIEEVASTEKGRKYLDTCGRAYYGRREALKDGAYVCSYLKKTSEKKSKAKPKA